MKKAQIVEKIKAEGRSVHGWARFRGYKVDTVHAVLAGRLRPTTRSYLAVTADLKADGYMTDEDES